MLDKNKKEIAVGDKVRFNPFVKVLSEGVVVELIVSDYASEDLVRIECNDPANETSAHLWNRYPRDVEVIEGESK